MARTDTLPHFLTDVADAIREKKGTQETITASDFDTEIANLSSGEQISDYIDTTVNFDISTNNVYKLIKKMENIELESNVKYISFNGNEKIEYISFAPNNAQLTSMNSTFYNCSKLVTAKLNELNLSNVSNLSYVFYMCGALKEVEIDDWDVSNVTSINMLFFRCNSIEKLNLNKWDTSKVTSLNQAFRDFGSLTELNISNWDVSKVTDFSSCFVGLPSLQSLDLSGWHTESATNFSNMFGWTTGLKHLDIRNFVFDNVTNYDSMFPTTSHGPVPFNCEIIVKSNNEKEWINTNFPYMTNVKTVDEYEEELNSDN